MRAGRCKDQGAIFYPDGTRPLYVNSLAVGKDGSVNDIRVVSGHPLLIAAALDAVRQWKYQVTLLNGQPVEVESQVTVRF